MKERNHYTYVGPSISKKGIDFLIWIISIAMTPNPIPIPGKVDHDTSSHEDTPLSEGLWTHYDILPTRCTAISSPPQLTISAMHILALSRSRRVLPGALSPLDEVLHRLEYLLHPAMR